MLRPTRTSTTRFLANNPTQNISSYINFTRFMHMNSKYIAGIALACLAFTACDDTTDNIGASLAEGNDGVAIQSASFDVVSRSIAADSVLSRNIIGYLGKVKDPETGAYITGDLMTQFNSLEGYTFPPIENLVTYDAAGNATYGKSGSIKADSCEIRLVVENYYGDAQQNMKITAYEMGKAMNENQLYYSNFNPLEKGYIAEHGIRQDKVYNMTDYNVPKSKRDTTNYRPYITVKLNDAYTDKDGKEYSNFGTYILEKYYSNPGNFKNSYTFRNNVVPGFFFKVKSGLGNMATIAYAQLNVYFKYKETKAGTTASNGMTNADKKDAAVNGISVFWGTEEVLQTSTISNDKETINKLVADESCTYLKTPAGIFTELTLPVDEIVEGHKSDSIVSAKLSLQRLNNNVTSNYAFDVPKNILMVQADSLYSFFEKGKIHDNKNSFTAAWGATTSTSSTDNTYTFQNISGMISAMKKVRGKSANWNKVVLVPVTLSKTQRSSNGTGTTSTVVNKVSNDMSLTSTRLVKGTSTNSPIKISVIYSRLK